MRSTVVIALLCAGCGSSTALDLDVGDDSGTTDAAIVRDDAGRDAGNDAGPPDQVCARDSDCSVGFCQASRRLSSVDLVPLPLACGEIPMGPLADGAPCRAREECERGLCGISGSCIVPCVIDTDCQAGERCAQIYVQTGDSALQPLTACSMVVTAPPGVRVAGPEPGPMIPDPGGFVTDPLASLAPSGHVVWIGDEGTFPILTRVLARDAASTVVFDAFAGGPDAPTPTWGVTPATITDIVTILFPNGPNTPSPPEGLAFEFTTFNSGTRSQRVTMWREGAPGTVMDIDAYLVGGNGWRVRRGEPPDDLRFAIEDAGAMFATMGITIGELRVHEVVGELRDRYSILEGEGPQGAPPELSELYRLSAGARRPSIHIFFVREIDNALGIASGIPGPHAMPGTGASGVAIAADLIPGFMMPGVIVHEVGHYMGLFHTSELDGSVNDPFPDTGECRTDRDRNFDGALLPDECDGAGADNVMFWAGTGPLISAQQGEVMRRAFFLH